jgi:hypothetical protein
MESDNAIFSNLPPDPAQQGSAGGWAPAAWKQIQALRMTQPAVADTIAGLTPDQASNYFFDDNAHNNMLSDVLTRHMQDQHLVTRTTTPPDLTFGPPPDPGQYRAQLEELRGQRPPQPSQPQPSGPTLEDYLYGSRSNAIQPASTPWNTFKLKPPNMPPFAANDNRSPGPPPGMTLNTSNNVTPLFGSMPMTAPPMLGHPTNLRQREKDILSRFETQ